MVYGFSGGSVTEIPGRFSQETWPMPHSYPSTSLDCAQNHGLNANHWDCCLWIVSGQRWPALPISLKHPRVMLFGEDLKHQGKRDHTEYIPVSLALMWDTSGMFVTQFPKGALNDWASDFSINFLSGPAHLLLPSEHSETTSCYTLGLKCPEKSCVLKAWSPVWNY